MDTVAMSMDLYDDTVAFVRTMSNTCDACLRRGIQCRECDLRVAAALLARLVERREVDGMAENPRTRRLLDILTAIRNSDDPIPSRDIVLPEPCSKFQKARDLVILERTGLVSSEKDEFGTRFFRIAPGMEFEVEAIVSSGRINF